MKFSKYLVSSALVALSSAHTTVFNILVNDVDQGTGNTPGGYIRSPPNNNPVKDLTSDDLTCNVANTPATRTVTAAAGDKIGIQWHHNDNTSSDDIIASSHLGPVLVYIAPTASNGTGNVWVKLAESGYENGTWAVQTLIANKGVHSFTLPSVLAPGNYLIRPEIIALHEADASYAVNPARGAQLYMECIQLNVTGTGATTLPTGVAIPGAYKETDPGIVFNLYGTFTSYTIPGPAVWDLAAGTSNTTSSAPSNTYVPAVSTSAAPAAPSGGASGPSTSTVYKCSSKTSSVSGAAPSAAPTAATSVSGVSGSVAIYSQCGGIGYTGSTGCVSGTTCKVINDYYSQCLSS
ncbi:carbohydrate-binding module family 1 protein [Hyaloscypha variabilis F]|uniref:AA9 family lytic polysaccharide monooxygenase n=1 Tax=Hyaloscypha variabilis (strain UAMH 11265 / GT02V1 / F) TaxID=1149755 RepID=A0A2J6RH19_HYAVF|nr:carbohydrate-binding module family 1 protein [Hyaloscypha variabilis F]